MHEFGFFFLSPPNLYLFIQTALHLIKYAYICIYNKSKNMEHFFLEFECLRLLHLKEDMLQIKAILKSEILTKTVISTCSGTVEQSFQVQSKVDS